MKISYFTLLLMILFMGACSDESIISNTNNPVNQNPAPSDWLIPKNQVLDGGPGKDGIPSIDRPNFTIASDVDFLNDNDLILGTRAGDVIKAYPHPILDWHEIVNDRIGDKSIALTYCPLTGTGIGWDRFINGVETTFGVSGLLYNSNLMPYDRASNSTWSQQRLDCVNGANKGAKANLHSFVETSWKTWKTAFPKSMILNTETGFNRDYQRYPYGDYRTNHGNIIFPISITDDRLDNKERVLGVRINENFKVYPFNKDKVQIEKIIDVFDGEKLIIVRSTIKNYIVAFKFPLDGTTLEVLSEDDFPAILQDSEGLKYDLLGHALEQAGKILERPDQMIGYWFSWGTFYPDLDILE